MPEANEQPTGEQDPSELTKEECFQEIGRVVGFRGYSRTQLRKRDINSTFWYLTGKTVARWMKFDTEESPSYILLRKALADELDMEYIDRWTDSRPYRRGELAQIVEAVRESDDHRQHS